MLDDENRAFAFELTSTAIKPKVSNTFLFCELKQNFVQIEGDYFIVFAYLFVYVKTTFDSSESLK